MKAFEIMNELYKEARELVGKDTVDVLKAGSADKDVNKIAVAMFPTAQIIEQAASWGADLLIVHEPLYYNHTDNITDDPLLQKKKAIIEKYGLTIYRYHDHPHNEKFDLICDGIIKALDLYDFAEHIDKIDLVRVNLDKGYTAKEFAALIEKKLSINHIRICGNINEKFTKLSFMCGAIGNYVIDEFKRSDERLVITGETCEWSVSEYVRDSAYYGKKQAMLVLGHANSEQAGMKLLTEKLTNAYPDIQSKFFDCGDVYTYSDC